MIEGRPETGGLNGKKLHCEIGSMAVIVTVEFYFHVTAAYAILRHCGVDLGKRDFLGAIPIRRS